MEQRTPAQSRTELTQLLPYYAINGADRLLGGYMLGCMDEVAAASAKRFCRTRVTTAFVDSAEFIAPPAKLGELFSATGVVTRAGNTSVEVKVEGCVESDDGIKRVVCRAYIVVVSLDENGKPAKVPQLLCETEEERQELARAEKREELRRERRKMNI